MNKDPILTLDGEALAQLRFQVDKLFLPQQAGRIGKNTKIWERLRRGGEDWR